MTMLFNGTLVVLGESFPTFKSALQFCLACSPGFKESPEYVRLIKHFTVYQKVNRVETWKVDGVLHRTDGPAFIEYYKNGNKLYEKWFFEGEVHRTDGPAVIWYYENGNKSFEEWYLKRQRHRTDGPAFIEYYENGNKSFEKWYLEDKLHRVDEPAYIQYYQNGDKETNWYLEGKFQRTGRPIPRAAPSKTDRVLFKCKQTVVVLSQPQASC